MCWEVGGEKLDTQVLLMLDGSEKLTLNNYGMAVCFSYQFFSKSSFPKIAPDYKGPKSFLITTATIHVFLIKREKCMALYLRISIICLLRIYF